VSEGQETIVYVVDDDRAVRESLRWLIESVGLEAATFEDPEMLLEACQPERCGCIILDVRMPAMSGLDLQEVLKQRGIEVPVLIVTGHGDVPMAVRALKAGAFDFIEKPYNDQLLLERVQQAIEQHRGKRQAQVRREELQRRLALLTPREREVMEGVVSGESNKHIARRLDLSIKTVEVHRANLMVKMQADSISTLVRMVLATEQDRGTP